jgi:hypothetical protein
VTGNHITVDSTYIKANASMKSLEPVVVDLMPKEYIQKLERENPIDDDQPSEPDKDYPTKGQKLSNSTHRSTSDPDARLARKSSSGAASLCHAATYVMDNKHELFGTAVNRPDMAADGEMAIQQLRRVKWHYRL